MERNLIRYIWTHTKKEQLVVLFLVLLSMVPYYLALDLPKQIVNGPIQGQGFESKGATQLFFQTIIDLPFIGKVELFPGMELDRLDSLWALSALFLAFVIIKGIFKLNINTLKGRLGERLLRRIRYELVDRILRFPTSYFKRAKAGEISSMVKDEVEPMGGFAGDAFVQPALLGGQALTALTFIFVQHFWLGMIAMCMALFQAFLIPKMRMRLIELGRQRQLTARELAGRVSEIIDGIQTIHAYDTSNYERAGIGSLLARIFRIRYDIYQWKFFVKFLNNFLAQLTPFLFYSIGGYLTIKGDLDVGQLVAVINAYSELPGPLKELIDWDLARQDVQVKYEQVIEQFEHGEMLEPDMQAINGNADQPLPLPLCAANVTLEDDSGAVLLRNASIRIEKGETVAFVGGASSGASPLAEALSRLLPPSSGRIQAAHVDLYSLPETITGRRISYASNNPYLFVGTLKENLTYGLKHEPVAVHLVPESEQVRKKWDLAEAKRTGNPTLDIDSDWVSENSIFQSGAGADNGFEAARVVLDAVQLTGDILDFALNTTVDLKANPDIPETVLNLRKDFRQELEARGITDLVVPFEFEGFNDQAMLIENFLFGNVVDTENTMPQIANNPHFGKVMSDTGLDVDFFEMGRTIASNLVELFADLPEDHPFFQNLDHISAEDIAELGKILPKVENRAMRQVKRQYTIPFIRLAAIYIEPRYRLGLLTDRMKTKIIAARKRFHAELDSDLLNLMDPYEADNYLSSANLLENILFGKVDISYGDASRQIRSILGDLLSRHQELNFAIMKLGLDFNVGAGGRLLTEAQRIKVGLARAIIRRSDYYVLNRPIAGFDPDIQDEIVRDTLALLSESADNPGVIWVLSHERFTKFFQRVSIFEQGTLKEDCALEDYIQKTKSNKELV
nr:ABC transporter transmembrane domain-containing protein [uncultured Cohaesibacter sp.]